MADAEGTADEAQEKVQAQAGQQALDHGKHVVQSAAQSAVEKARNVRPGAGQSDEVPGAAQA